MYLNPYSDFPYFCLQRNPHQYSFSDQTRRMLLMSTLYSHYQVISYDSSKVVTSVSACLMLPEMYCSAMNFLHLEQLQWESLVRCVKLTFHSVVVRDIFFVK